jgi:uncharacterized protein YacL
MWLKYFINEIQMFLTGALGIMLRYAYMRRKEEALSKVRVWTYFFISFGVLVLLIIYLSDKKELFGLDLQDTTKMIISAIGSLFSERFFTFLMDKDEDIFNKILKKYFGNESK